MSMSRFYVVGFGFLVGSILSGCSAVTLLPSNWGTIQKIKGWLWFMSGPFCLYEMGVWEMLHPFVDLCVRLGFLGMLLLFAHPLRPSLITAGLTLLGFFFWFLASFFSVVCVVWGA